jgi:hypothetical protein
MPLDSPLQLSSDIGHFSPVFGRPSKNNFLALIIYPLLPASTMSCGYRIKT